MIMERVTVISRTDLARRTRQIVDRVRRGDTVLVESYGEEQIVLVDILDYRIMRAVAAYHALSPHSSPLSDPETEPSGLTEAELLESEPQVRWNRVIAAYLDGQINLGRAASLLDLSRFELDDRFRRLDVPRRMGAETLDEARSELEAISPESEG
jgi:prevent-host-death family protein